MLALRVATSSSSFLRSISTCCALCLIASRLLERFHARRACRQLRFEIALLQRQSFYLRFDLLDLLLSILKNEQLFQFRMHGSRSY